MKNVMIFKCDRARNFLLIRGYVFTFRERQRKSTGRGWINDGWARPKIADVFISEIGGLHWSHLELYAPYSGFESFEEWLAAIKELNRGYIPSKGWLYLVQLVRHGMRKTSPAKELVPIGFQETDDGIVWFFVEKGGKFITAVKKRAKEKDLKLTIVR